MKLKGVIFDLDGTLGDTFPVILPAYRHTLAQYSERSFTDEDIIALFGPTEEGIFKRIVPKHWQECLRVYEEEYQKLSRVETRRFPGIEDTLRMLKQHDVKLAIVTGKALNTAHISLNELGLTSNFDFIEGGSAEGIIKPACIRKILAHWGFQPQQVAYVGDAPSDMRDAREVGVVPLAAAWYDKANIDALEHQNPVALFRDIASFRSWLEQHVNGRIS